MKNKITLIAGVPCPGKTTFGDYLRDKKGYQHVDMEAFGGSYLHTIWEVSLSIRRLDVFLQALKEKSAKTVPTWGFHPNDTWIVDALKKRGVLSGSSRRMKMPHGLASRNETPCLSKHSKPRCSGSEKEMRKSKLCLVKTLFALCAWMEHSSHSKLCSRR
jgi:hypothetical protein